MDTKEWLLTVIRQAVLEQPGNVPDERPESFDELFRLAVRHDLAHVVSYYLDVNHIPAGGQLAVEHRRIRRYAVYRETKQEYVKDRLFAALQREKIEFIPLKGASVRTLYPQSWMRTSCDLDVLIHEEDLERAAAVLTTEGFTTDGVKRYHDMVFLYQDVRLELHYCICENIRQLDKLLKKVWTYSERAEGVEYRQSDAFFLFHHLAHMCYHFNQGGCGVRSFIDLYLLRKAGCPESELQPMLDSCGLRTFYEQACAMTAVWFEGQPHTEVTAALESYILNGGVFGSDPNFYAVQSNRRMGRFRFLFRKVFPPLCDMKTMYPVLRKSGWALLLLPALYLHRLYVKLIGRERYRGRKAIHDYKSMGAQDHKVISSAGSLMKSLGLSWLL